MATTRIDAERHAEQIQAFYAELSNLEQEQVLTLSTQQHEHLNLHHTRLLNHYRQTFNIDQTEKAKQLSLGMRVASLLGALALAASLWFGFYQIWDVLNPLSQVATTLGACVLSLVLTLWLKSRDHDGYFTQMAGISAWVCLVINSYVLGDIYNLTPTAHTFGLWGGYALLLAQPTQSRLLFLTGWGLLASYLTMLLSQALGMDWQEAYEHPECWLVAASLLYLAPRVTKARPLLMRNLGIFIGLASLAILAFWGGSSLLPWSNHVIEIGYLTLALAAAVMCIYLGIWHNNRWQYRLGVVFSLLILLAKAFDTLWDRIPHALFFLLVSLAAIGVLVLLKRQHYSVQLGAKQ